MNSHITPETQESIIKLYQSVRIKIGNNNPISLLHISEENTIIASGESSEKPDHIVVLPMGSKKTPEDFFRHVPPTPEEIEYAINFLEDHIIPCKKELPINSELYSASPAIQEISSQWEKDIAAETTVLPIRDMEDIFSRLSAIITGRPYSTDTLPETFEFAASLLILREIMHHLAFHNITILKSL